MLRDKLIDKRYPWFYKGCKIIPVTCSKHKGEWIDFGYGFRSRYWRIDFPDKTWVHVATKEECRKYIKNMKAKSLHGLYEEKL